MCLSRHAEQFRVAVSRNRKKKLVCVRGEKLVCGCGEKLIYSLGEKLVHALGENLVYSLGEKLVYALGERLVYVPQTLGLLSLAFLDLCGGRSELLLD